MTAAENCSSAS